jgi:hypothetical protein
MVFLLKEKWGRIENTAPPATQMAAKHVQGT